MQISLDGVTVVLSDEHMDKLTNALAERLLPRLEENWARYLQTQLAAVEARHEDLTGTVESLVKTVDKLASDHEDLESRLDDSDSKMDDFVSSSDLDVDDVNNAVERINSFDSDSVTDLEARIDQLEAGTSVKAIIEKIAHTLLESVSIEA